MIIQTLDTLLSISCTDALTQAAVQRRGRGGGGGGAAAACAGAGGVRGSGGRNINRWTEIPLGINTRNMPHTGK